MLLVVLVTAASGLFASQSILAYLAPAMGSIFTWESTTHDFGIIEQSNPAEHIFKFTNDGDQPLIISNVKASCGCTIAEYTKEPIAPGQKGSVSARYNAAKIGAFTKTVSVIANTDTVAVVLTLKGVVAAAK